MSIGWLFLSSSVASFFFFLNFMLSFSHGLVSSISYFLIFTDMFYYLFV